MPGCFWLSQTQSLQVFICYVLIFTLFLVYLCGCASVLVCMCICSLTHVHDCIWSSDICFVMHGSPGRLGFPWAPSCGPIHFYPIYSSTSLSFSPPSFPSLSSSLSLSFVYLVMCEIILGWRDEFLPEGLSRGVSLLFNNRLGVYVYLFMVIDYRLVLDNKPHSGGQTDDRVRRLSNIFKSRQTLGSGLGTPAHEKISLLLYPWLPDSYFRKPDWVEWQIKSL